MSFTLVVETHSAFMIKLSLVMVFLLPRNGASSFQNRLIEMPAILLLILKAPEW